MTPARTPPRNRAAKPRREASETVFFDDKERLRGMVGAGDRFLILIEQELGVRLSAPGGGQIVITAGDGAARDEAKHVLKRLYASLEHGLTCDEAAVRAALRMRDSEGAGGEAEDGVIRVPRGSSLIARTEGQRDYVRALKNDKAYDLVFGVGPAGTGKTLLAVAYGASLLVQRKVEKLIITRPAVEAGEKLGFLPGDLTEKVDPYLLPVWDALADTLGRSQLEKMREDGRIEVAPLGLHARPHPQPRLRGGRRGPEHVQAADADGADPPWRRLAHGGDGRSEPDRPASARTLRPRPCAGHSVGDEGSCHLPVFAC